MSLISVFNKACANELSKYGFQKLKGLACFGRIINNEIFQYVMPVNRKSLEKNKKAFTIASGVFTVYSPALDKGLFENYGKYFIDFEFMDRLPHNDLIRLCDLSYDVSSIQTVVDQSIKGFISIMLPYLDQITTLNDYVSYCKRMNISLLRNAEKMWGDSILLVKTNNHDDFIDEYNSICRSVFGEEYNNYNDADSIRTKRYIMMQLLLIRLCQEIKSMLIKACMNKLCKNWNGEKGTIYSSYKLTDLMFINYFFDCK